MTERISSERLPWIDNVKMVAMIAIIFGHSYSYLHGSMAVGASVIQQTLVAFAIPLFIFISGYTSFKSAVCVKTFDELTKYIKKITLRLGFPNFCATAITGAIQNVADADWIKFIIHLVMPCLVATIVYLHKRNRLFTLVYNILIAVVLALSLSCKLTDFWFLRTLLQMLVVLSVISSVTQMLLKKSSLAFILLLYMPCMYLYPSDFCSTGEFVIYFILGYMLSRSRYSNQETYNNGVIVTALVLAVFFLYLTDGHDFYNYSLHTLLAFIGGGENLCLSTIMCYIMALFLVYVYKKSFK